MVQTADSETIRFSLTAAALSTFDSNDYFIIGITTRALNIIVQDGDSTAP